MHILVTGVAGFLGSHLADALIARGHTVVGCDNLVGGAMLNVPNRVEFYFHDCRIQKQMLQISRKCDVVFHCAALAHEGLSSFSPSLIVDNIVGASTAVFSAAIENHVRRIVFCSSMARYGNGSPPFTEQDNPKPVDPYGIAKVSAEYLLKSLSRVHGFEYVIAVPHNIIGPRQKYDDPYRNVASIMANRMLRRKPPIIYGDGTQKRSFSDIRDVVPCLVKMAEQDNVIGETINIGPDNNEITINELCDHLRHITGCTLPTRYMPGRPAEVRNAWCSSDLSRKLLQFNATTPLTTSLIDLVADIRARKPRQFEYHISVEINSEKTPATWKDHLI